MAKGTRRRGALVALAKMLGGAKSAAIAKEVALAVDDAEAYLKKTKHELFEDWDDDDTDDVPWLALIEALNVAGRLAEVDWKEAASDVLAKLERIGGGPAKKALQAADERLDERFTDEAIAMFGKLLGPAKLALVQLYKDSDSYALMVIPPGRVAALGKLARAAGGDMIHWTGKNFAELEAERMRKLARDKTRNPWRMLVVARSHKRGTRESEAQNVLFDIRHDEDGSLRAELRKVLPYVPPRDRPLVEMSLALNEQAASRIAKTTRDPKLCLRALRNVNDRKNPKERLWAASILATRLKIKPDKGILHEQFGVAVNLWPDDDAAADAALAKLPAADRDRLARLADGLLGRNGTQIRDDGARAMGWVGDATSLALLEAIDAKERAAAQERAKSGNWSPDPWHSLSPVPKALERLRKRVRRK